MTENTFTWPRVERAANGHWRVRGGRDRTRRYHTYRLALRDNSRRVDAEATRMKRDLIQGDPTALANTSEERRRQLDTEWTRLDAWATQAEATARVAREKASAVRAQLDATLTELQRLAVLKETT